MIEVPRVQHLERPGLPCLETLDQARGLNIAVRQRPELRQVPKGDALAIRQGEFRERRNRLTRCRRPAVADQPAHRPGRRAPVNHHPSAPIAAEVLAQRLVQTARELRRQNDVSHRALR